MSDMPPLTSLSSQSEKEQNVVKSSNCRYRNITERLGREDLGLIALNATGENEVGKLALADLANIFNL